MDKEGPLHVLPAELDRLANSILGNQSIEEGQKSGLTFGFIICLMCIVV